MSFNAKRIAGSFGLAAGLALIGVGQIAAANAAPTGIAPAPRDYISCDNYVNTSAGGFWTLHRDNGSWQGSNNYCYPGDAYPPGMFPGF